VLVAFDWVAAEVSLLGVCVLDCEAGAAAEADAAFGSVELKLAAGLAVDELAGLLAAEFELLLISELVPLAADGLVLPVAAGAAELLLLGVEALWFIADVSLEPPGVVAAEDGEVVLPVFPLLLPLVQWSAIIVTELTWKVFPELPLLALLPLWLLLDALLLLPLEGCPVT
jgi:hypothetical protein